MKPRILSLILIFSTYLSMSLFSQGWEPKGPLVNGSSVWINCMTTEGSNIYVGTSCTLGGVFRSKDFGDSWEHFGEGLPPWSIDVYALTVKDTLLFVGMNSSSLEVSSINYANFNTTTGPSAYCLATIGNNILAGSTTSGVQISPDNGITWFDYSSPDIDGKIVYSFCMKGSDLYAGTSSGIYKLTNLTLPWVAVNVGIPGGADVYSLGVNGSSIFAGTYDKGIFLSKDNGVTWKQVNTGLVIEKTRFKAFAFKGSNIFAAASGTNGNIYESTDNGTNWTEITTGLPSDTEVDALAINGEYIFAGTGDNGVFRRALSELVSTSPIENDNNTIAMYPNPTNGHLSVSLKSIKSKEVEINGFSLLGKKIFSKRFEVNNGELHAEFNLPSIEKGFYTIQIVNGVKSIYTKQLYVQ